MIKQNITDFLNLEVVLEASYDFYINLYRNLNASLSQQTCSASVLRFSTVILLEFDNIIDIN